jgi:protein-S-isoprenylcysteine O-methyltransferase Ste14
MQRLVFFVYGVFCHLLFLVVYAYLAAFLGNFLVPRALDQPATGDSTLWAAGIDLALVMIFALQHSVMARPAFKRVWTRLVPTPIERSTYVLASCLVTVLLMWQWRPIPLVIWHVEQPVAWWMLTGLFVAGLLGVPAVSLMINHFDLFGTRQVWLHLRQQEYTSLEFRTPLAYALVRHPLYIGWALAFWCTPTMTAGHFLFAAAMTAYMGIATIWEERDLLAHFGEQYADYRRRVPRFVPLPLRRTAKLPELPQVERPRPRVASTVGVEQHTKA